MKLAGEPSATLWLAGSSDTVTESSVIVAVAVFAVGWMDTLDGSGAPGSASISTRKVSSSSDRVSAAVATVNAAERVAPAAMVSEVAAWAV